MPHYNLTSAVQLPCTCYCRQNWQAIEKPAEEQPIHFQEQESILHISLQKSNQKETLMLNGQI